MTQLAIIGIRGTLHTTRGDIEMGPPVRVSMDGEYTTFTFVKDAAPFSARLTGFTLYLGTLPVALTVTPDYLAGGNEIVVTQTTVQHSIEALPNKRPDWVRT